MNLAPMPHKYSGLRWTGILLAITLTWVFLAGCASFQGAEAPFGTGEARIHSLSSDPRAAYSFGRYLQNKGKHGLALNEMSKVVQADPSHVRAYNAMGVSYDVMGEYSQAVACYQAALELDPKLAWVHNNLGVSLLMQGRVQEAMEPLRRAVALKPDSARYHNNLGLAYLQADRVQEALAQFEMANGGPRAHRMLAEHYQRQGRGDLARKHLDKAVVFDFPQWLKEPTRTGSRANNLTRTKERTSTSHEARHIYKGKINSDLYLTADRGLDSQKSRHTKQFRASQRQESHLSKPAASSAKPESGDSKGTDRIQTHPRRAIEISNGNGVRRMAARVKHYLISKGLHVTRLTNADHFGHAGTVIYYRPEHEQEAYEIAQYIPGDQAMREVERLDWESIKIKVLIGRDIVRYDGPQFNAR